ncbi:MAG: CoB--CoM heterodisulfide reductase iron-sulfur subunit D [Candidatus Thorarchaeota archaeon]|nr:MAG: CoB--CoM heterodisulfide reductase iron-sulfur subunit D [Candidatus Thorarchaeota archaeon]
MTLEEKQSREGLLDAALSCVHCGLCYHTLPSLTESERFSDTCPAGLYFGFDAYYSPGRNELARAILRGEYPLKESKAIEEIIFSCTTCGACEATCRYVNDTNVLPVHVTEGIRALLVEQGVGPLPSQKKFAESVKKVDNPYGESSERNMWIEDQSRRDKLESDVFYFVGCTTGYRYQDIAKATTTVLETTDTDYSVSSKEICCGSPLIRTGQLEDVERLVRENVKVIQESGAKTVIFSCAGCYRTVVKDWPRILGEDLPFETIHVTQFMAEKMDSGELELNEPMDMKIAYHDPCHLGRHMFPNAVYDEPRKVIDSIPGAKRITLDREMDATLCCGSGGGVKAGLPEYAEYIAKLRVSEARNKGADTFVTACPFCVRGLEDGAKKEASESGDKPLEVIELTELVRRAIGGK